MKFSELLNQAGVAVADRTGEADVTDVQIDSRRCGAGSCFVAVRGAQHDGHDYVAGAVDAGCSAVVCENARAVNTDVPHATVDDTRNAAGRLAQAIRGWPARRLTAAAVTGTNGKTTVAQLIRAVLTRAGRSAGLLGTIRYETPHGTRPAATTTPGPIALAELTAEMTGAGCTHLVMEVSSHALDQRRTAGLAFVVGVFTNLSGDHLDYHGTMGAYVAAKRRLFEGLAPEARAIINRDDPAGETMAAATRAEVLWFGLSPASDVWARIERLDASGSRFALCYDDREVPVTTPLIGRHNVLNCVAAGAAGLALGIELDVVAEGLACVQRVPGRLQRVAADAGFQVFVDYAHTDDALKNVLTALKPLEHRRLILVFGCGGDRDRAKRPRMARIAQELADRMFITSDNPRSESPQAIIDEIVAGLDESGRARTTIEPDRRAAISGAIDEAEPGDIVLIAGKGHETYQDLGSHRVDFDDVAVADASLRRRGVSA
ncbi:MAG: UDP-N-acetylmuramoyl-L-alanyl-D-glutamate--2,6-diaminopimelate ligase [Phycisphaerae bacterium]|nr:UDP-N-acetylmuramoyl-L-alanyl-D-glutamate--2,6-diaminopimelate ligase [Phycisphaerae bacterium]